LWTAEASGAEAFATLAAAGASAPMALGTGVLALQLRTPPLAAMGAATLQNLYPDREILLGVGVSSPAVAGRWHGAHYSDRPLAQVREYVELVRHCLSGETVDHRGDFYSVSKFRLGVRLGERRPRIVVAALNEAMLALGGEIADGVLLNYLPSSHVGWSVEQIRRGGSATVYAYIHACVGDRAAHLESARRDLFGYATAPGYQRMFTAAGYGPEMEALRQALGAGDRDGSVAAISDRMAMDINTVGSADHVRRFTQAYVDAGVEVPIVMAMPWGSDRRAVVIDTLTAAIG
jgi:probable F420-dependent oxidoreductase